MAGGSLERGVCLVGVGVDEVHQVLGLSDHELDVLQILQVDIPPRVLTDIGQFREGLHVRQRHGAVPPVERGLAVERGSLVLVLAREFGEVVRAVPVDVARRVLTECRYAVGAVGSHA